VPASRRLFVGLEPPPGAREALARAARSTLGARSFRLYAAPDVHLTLCFLGEVLEAARPALVAALAASLAGARAFRARIAGAGAFPRPGRERVLWAGLALEPEARARLLDLVQRTEAAVRACGLACDERPAPDAFEPHLTLARPRPGARVPAEFYALAFDLAWEPGEVCLFESVREPTAAGRYPALARFPLQPA
jgi:2'-5' RNA ligase